jgi:peptidoglycan/xylan/chitin deacetylase (PgdA/CDA1 family)
MGDAFQGQRLALVIAIASAMLALSTTTATASSSPGRPLHIHASTLTQDGQQLVWRLQLDDPFSPAGLAPDQRSLCLLIERVANGTVTGEACIAGPSHHSREPRLVYLRITSKGAGPPRAIKATITRSGSHDLLASFLPAAVGAGYSPLRWQAISTLRSSACASPAPDRAGCFTLTPSKPTLLKLHAPRLVGCVPRGPSWVFHGPTNVREIALTFDDGPWYDTARFLDLLERDHVPATFFEIGRQIGPFGQAGAIERRMLADGDMVGDHTWNHANVSAGGSFAASEISQTAAAIRNATGGFEPCLFRAPGGAVSPALTSVARSLGFATIQWNIDPRDWARPGTQAIYQNVISNARDGAIVIQHDGGGDRSETLAALPHEIDALRRAGYRFVTVTQMLGYRLLYR